MKAREYFEQAQNAAQDMHSASLRLAALRDSEQLQAVRYDKDGNNPNVGDAMKATDERIDYESVFAERIEAAQAIIDDAFAFLYGMDGRHGLSRALGNRYADVLCAHYLQLETYVDLAHQMGCGDRYLRMLADEAMMYIDRVGFAKIRADS